MSMTDPISDMLTRIRNATMVRHDRTDVDFFSVVGRLTEVPIAPPVTFEEPGATAQADLDLDGDALRFQLQRLLAGK